MAERGGFVLDPSFSYWIGRRAQDYIGSYAVTYVRIVRQMMEDSPRGGRIYMRQGLAHKASAPGEAPAPWSRELVDSITVQDTSGSQGRISTTIVVSTEASTYVKALEFGTSRMWPRPVWRPALLALRSVHVTAASAA